MQKQKIKIVLDDDKIKKVLKIKDVIKVVEEGFKKKGLGLVNLPPKLGPKLDTLGAFADSMTVSVFTNGGGRAYPHLQIFGVKWLSAYTSNLKKRLPYLNSVIVLNEPECGMPIAVLSGNWITAIRTAGVSAVCAKYLAPKKKELTVGMFGLGVQAYVHVLAFKSIFKNVKFILYNHDSKLLSDFLRKFPKERFKVTKDFHEVVKNSDVILSATTFPPKIAPYIFSRDLKNDVLILPLEYGTRIDPGLYKKLDEIYTDDIPQYELKSKFRNYFPQNKPKIKKEIGEIIAKNYKRGNKPKKILVFNLGIALFDILTAKEFLNRLQS
ncbi:MAG: ornithine cyclodeaminase family protein [Candidatus Melainabacteria bacterium]|nr:ornithine cyclodeaminase family protein [Candidatus Melainabacteria bacterium]